MVPGKLFFPYLPPHATLLHACIQEEHTQQPLPLKNARACSTLPTVPCDGRWGVMPACWDPQQWRGSAGRMPALELPLLVIVYVPPTWPWGRSGAFFCLYLPHKPQCLPDLCLPTREPSAQTTPPLPLPRHRLFLHLPVACCPHLPYPYLPGF